MVLGTIESVADGLSSFSKLGAGYIADRLGVRKVLVVTGYGLTALMQVFMAVAVGWPLILLNRVIGWFGRGIRGPLRDAIMAEAITPTTRGRAFGFHRAALRTLPADFRRYLRAVGLFGLRDFAHTLLIAAATALLTPRFGLVQAAQLAGLLYVVRNVVQTTTSFPVGVVADRLGHRPVLVFGYARGATTATLVVVAFAVQSDSLILLGVVFVLAGLYIAVQEAVEASMTADYVPPEAWGMGYGVLGAINGVGHLFSSVVVGVLWSAVSPVLVFGVAAGVMAAGTLMMGLQRR